MHGLWQVTFESGPSVILVRSTWTTVIEHASGWRLEYDETTRRYALFAPHADEPEVIRELTLGSGEVALRLIDAAVEMIQDNAADRGLPGLI